MLNALVSDLRFALRQLRRSPGPDYLDWQARNHTFRGMAAVYGDAQLMSREKGAGVIADLNRVSTNYFDVLGVQPMMGRNLRLLIADVARNADRSCPGAAGRVGVAVRHR